MFLHVSIIHSFLLLSRITIMGYTSLRRLVFLLLLGSKVELLNHKVSLRLTLEDAQTPGQKGGTTLYANQQCMGMPLPPQVGTGTFQVLSTPGTITCKNRWFFPHIPTVFHQHASSNMHGAEHMRRTLGIFLFFSTLSCKGIALTSAKIQLQLFHLINLQGFNLSSKFHTVVSQKTLSM